MLTPLAEEESFDDWWNRASNMVNVQVQKGLNSLVVHGAWSHGPYGSTETVASLMELLLIFEVPCRLFRMKHNAGDLQELKGLLPCV